MRRLWIVTMIGIVPLTLLLVVRQHWKPRVAPSAPPVKLLSFSRAEKLVQTSSSSAAPTLAVRTDSGHTLLLHQAIEQTPAWAVQYGQEFWRKQRDRPAPHVDTATASPANIDLGNITERVSSAITLANGADLPQAHTRTYAATFDGEGFRLSPNRFVGYKDEPADAADDFESAGTHSTTKIRTIYEPDPSTELRFRTASIRTGGAELYADDGQPRTWSVLGNTAQRLLNQELGLVEHYETDRGGVEVSWVISERPSTLGNLEIEAELTGLFLANEDEAGLHFADRDGTPRVLVGQCSVVDDNGKRIQVPIVGEGSQLRAVVPEAMLSEMAFPVAIDPIVGPEAGMGVAMAPGWQVYPSAASNGTNYLVVWPDPRLLGSQGYNIFGARVSSAGKVLDPTGIVITSGTNGQVEPKVASNGSDFLVAYKDGTNAPDGAAWHNIACTRVLADGSVTNSASVTSTNAVRQRLNIACNGTNYLIVWDQAPGQEGTSDLDVFGARVSSVGAPLDFEGFVINHSPASPDGFPVQMEARVASDKANFFVIWHDLRRNAGESDIYGTKVLNSGSVTDTNGVLIQTNAALASVAWAASPTNYLVVFQTQVDAPSTHGRRVTAALSLIDSTNFLINSTHQPNAITSNGTNFFVVVLRTNVFKGVRIRGSDGTVLDDTPVIFTTQDAVDPAVASDGRDFLVVWDDSPEQEHDGHVFGARVSAAGVPLDWIPISTIEAEDDAQRFPAIATGYFAVWEDDRGISTNGVDIYGTRLTAGGLPQDFAGIPICTTTGDQQRPAICVDPVMGPWLVVWMDNRNGTSADIYGARVSGGTVLDTNGFAISTATNSQQFPSVFSVGNGYLVAWMDARNSGSSLDIYGARVSSSGSVLDTSGIAINTQSNPQRNPRVSGVNDMYFVVYFSAQRNGIGDYDIFGTRVTTSGTVLDSTGIAICTAANDQAYPSVATDGTDFLAVWRDGRVSTNWDIYAARIQTNGTVLDSNGFVVSSQSGSQDVPYVANPGYAPYLVVWQHPGNSADVYGAFVTNNATVSTNFIIDAGDSTQASPQVAANGATFLTLYSSTRLGTPGRIRGRLITP